MANSNSRESKKARARTAARWIKQQEDEGAYRLYALLPADTAAKLKELAAQQNKSIRATIIALIDAAE